MKFITLIGPTGANRCPQCDNWHFNMTKLGEHVYFECTACHKTVGTIDVISEEAEEEQLRYSTWKSARRGIMAAAMVLCVASGMLRGIFVLGGDALPQLIQGFWAVGCLGAAVLAVAVFYGMAREGQLPPQ